MKITKKQSYPIFILGIVSFLVSYYLGRYCLPGITMILDNVVSMGMVALFFGFLFKLAMTYYLEFLPTALEKRGLHIGWVIAEVLLFFGLIGFLGTYVLLILVFFLVLQIVLFTDTRNKLRSISSNQKSCD